MVLTSGQQYASGKQNNPVIIQIGKFKIHVADDGTGKMILYAEGHKPNGAIDYIHKENRFFSSKLATITFDANRRITKFVLEINWNKAPLIALH